MWILKQSLNSRIKGDNKHWLQQVAPNTPCIFNRIDFILDYCREKSILHIGFTDYPYTSQKINEGSLLHIQLQKVAADLIGMDIDETAIQEYISQTGDRKVFNGDITIEYPASIVEYAPDLILLSEVLEHLRNPYQAINVLHNSFPAGTKVLVTVPNYTALDSFAASLNQTESIHPHHHWYFSPYTLRQLLDAKRFELEQLDFGMYYQPKTNINIALRDFPFNGDCIIGIFTIIKNKENA
jgi:hypothetical protein